MLSAMSSENQMPTPKLPQLPQGQWFPHNHAVLSRFLAQPPTDATAAFDWDDTCIFSDIGTAAFVYQLDTLTLRLAPHVLAALWQSVVDKVSDPTQRLGYQAWLDDVCTAYAVLWPACIAAMAPVAATGATLAAHHDFRVKLARLVALLSHTGDAATTAAAYAGMAAMWAGYSEQAVCAYVPAIVAHAQRQAQLQQPWQQASLGAAGAWSQQLPPAPRPYAEMHALFAALAAAGVGVYVVSASLQALVLGAVSLWQYACAPKNVIGMRLAHAPGAQLHEPIMLPRMLPGAPLTYRQGKSDAIAQHLPTPPVLVAGDAMTDYEMLTHSAVRVRLLLHRPPHAAPMAQLFAQAWQPPTNDVAVQTLAQGHDARTGGFTPAQRSSPAQTRNTEQMP